MNDTPTDATRPLIDDALVRRLVAAGLAELKADEAAGPRRIIDEVLDDARQDA